MTKRATKRAFLAVVMLAMLLCTTSLLAEQEVAVGGGEAGGGEETAGYCQTLATNCNSQCLSAWYGCRSMGQNPDTCQNQYDWCMDDCWGWGGDFWCGYRQF